MSRESVPHRESHLTKVLAVLLLLVAGALVFTVIQQRKQTQQHFYAEPRPVAQRPDDKLGADEQATIEVFEKFSRSVVHVTSLMTRRNLLTRDATDIPQGVGTGFIWDQNGHIVTNAHVIEGADRASVTLDDGSTYAATIVGKALTKDLAVLHIDAPPQKLLPLPVGQSASLKVGQKVLAIGNPFGLDHTLTTGVISGLNREIQSLARRPIQGVIQTDAAINPGNSGGPLLDSAGRLIGINTAIYTQVGQSAGIGFAVPVDTVNQIVPELITHGRITRPGLGISIWPDMAAEQAGIEGVIINQVFPNSGAAAAGLSGTVSSAVGTEVHDTIVGIDNVEVKRERDLYKAIDAHKVGDVIDVTVEDHSNGRRKRTVKVTLQAVQ